MKSFVTETDTKYIRQQSYITALVLFVVLSALVSLCLLVSQKIFAAAEIVVILACLMMVSSKKQDRHHYRLRMEGSTLHVENLAGGGSFSLPELGAEDFIIRQSRREIKLDYCTLLINGTAYAFGGVKNCSGLKEHIERNCR